MGDPESDGSSSGGVEAALASSSGVAVTVTVTTVGCFEVGDRSTAGRPRKPTTTPSTAAIAETVAATSPSRRRAGTVGPGRGRSVIQWAARRPENPTNGRTGPYRPAELLCGPVVDEGAGEVEVDAVAGVGEAAGGDEGEALRP
ncbi:hypothetical protein [Streptomyces longispororuber]|uniref:hypothetical protein n=1 Tax=Streptomyces longispororuber TaxID=68230 RepID=UPI00210C32D1|nr:hypothetical protein [Streptomyces longispororuber]MCQ4212329.1 hypothetical protein [Streptomyces longispororuber]